jgi:hypothetical protein
VLKVLLYLFSILTLVCAGVVFVFCADRWLQYAHNNKQDEGPSIVEKFQKLGDTRKTDEQEKVSSLVSQSGE